MSENVGATERRELALILFRMNDQQFAAFAMLCAKRIGPLFRQFFGNAIFQEEVIRTLSDAALGKPTRTNAESLRQKAEGLIEELYGTDDTDYPMESVKVLSASLTRMARRDWDSPEHVAFSGQDAAACSGVDDVEAAVLEEARWQLHTAKVIEAQKQISEGQLEALATMPIWHQSFQKS